MVLLVVLHCRQPGPNTAVSLMNYLNLLREVKVSDASFQPVASEIPYCYEP